MPLNSSMMYCQAAVTVSDISQVGEIRRQANQLASDAGLNEEDRGKVSIIASELATNLAHYSPNGEILLRSFEDQQGGGVELLAIDRGPGMANITKCLGDGFSTGGTPGNGLGAVQRLASEFDIFSMQPGGTVVLARVRTSISIPRSTERFEWGVVNRPAPYETANGDTWRISERPGQLSVLVADGLGHGPQAAEAADTAAAVFEQDGFSCLTDFLTRADRRMRGTRGAAIAVAQVNLQQGLLSFAGVGNIAGHLRSRQEATGRGLVSHNGTLGVEMRKVQEFEYPFPKDALLVMHSDGLQSRWSLEPYPGLIHRHPAVIAGVLYRDFTRGRDDVTVCVVRLSNSSPWGDAH